MIILWTLLALVVLYFVGRFIRLLYYFHKLPGNWANFEFNGVGLALKFAGSTEADRYRIMRAVVRKYPYASKHAFGHMLVWFINDADLIQRVLTSQSLSMLEKPYFYRFLAFGNGLITGNVDVWRHHRRVLNNAFSLRALQSFVTLFDDCSKTFVSNIAEHLNQGPFNLCHPYATKCAMASNCCKCRLRF